jgi:hypothetical protein
MEAMRFRILQIILIIVLSSCSQNSDTDGTLSKRKEERIKKEATVIAENYADGQLKNAQRTTTDNGLIILSDDRKKYVIQPAGIIIGLIDEDEKYDAIVTIKSFSGQDLLLIEHLFMINTDNKLMLLRVIESDMRILELKDRIITAELPTHPRTSPLYNCASCQEIVKYRFEKGDTVRTDQ